MIYSYVKGVRLQESAYGFMNEKGKYLRENFRKMAEYGCSGVRVKGEIFVSVTRC